MAKPSGKSTTSPRRTVRAYAERLRRQGTSQAIAEFARHLDGQDDPPDPPPATAEPSSSEAPTPEPPTSTSPPPSSAPPAPPASTSPTSASQTPRRAGQGPQLDEAKRILREIYPTEGKAPAGLTYKAIWVEVSARTPEGKKPASEDVVAAAVKALGRSGQV